MEICGVESEDGFRAFGDRGYVWDFLCYPFRNETTFSAPGHEELGRMLEIGWRTARLCANETYMDCPYYEQLQYFGDTRIQAMISMYNTSDPYMVKNAIEQGRQSMVAEGITMSRYPSSVHQLYPRSLSGGFVWGTIIGCTVGMRHT